MRQPTRPSQSCGISIRPPFGCAERRRALASTAFPDRRTWPLLAWFCRARGSQRATESRDLLGEFLDLQSQSRRSLLVEATLDQLVGQRLLGLPKIAFDIGQRVGRGEM